jgi:hypothetical protein
MSDSLPTDGLPVIGNRYWVRCENSWCMAVVDKDGKWKSFSNGKELRDVVNFFPI